MDNNKQKHDVSLGTLYDFNKQMVLKDGVMSEKAIKEIKPELELWFNDINKYAMLLCRERYDFTVFQLYTNAIVSNSAAQAVKELIQVLRNRGQILSIEKDVNHMNNAWEIWVKIEDDVYAYYLFDCEEWVIRC